MEVQNISGIMNDIEVTLNKVDTAGCHFILMCCGKRSDSLINILQYVKCVEMVEISMKIEPHTLAHASTAAYWHSLQAPLQIMKCKKLFKYIDPTKWG